MDTPRSESPSGTYQHNAVPVDGQLDDHRFQPHSLPRYRTVTGAFINDHEGLMTLGSLNVARTRTTDSDTAINSDDTENHHLPHGTTAFDFDTTSPLARAPTHVTMDDSRSARFSHGSSSRSPSPPNSVDAFADPDRRFRDRSNTFNSQRPDLSELGLERVGSRRATFTEDEHHGSRMQLDNHSVKATEDVCFPPPEENKTRSGIDFEEMDEFVAEQNAGRHGQRQRKMSLAGSFRGRHNPDKDTASRVNSPTSDECAIDDTASSIDEKTGEKVEHLAKVSKPDRFSFFSSELDTTIHAPEFGDLLCEGESFRDIFRDGMGVWWLDCLNPSPEELAMLMKAFSIHPLTAEDIRVQETREKVELFRSYYFVCFRSFVQDKTHEDYMEPINIYIIVFREGVLSFHFEAANHSANVRRRIRQLRDYVALSSDWICYALIDDIVDSFAPLINDVEQDSDAIEDAVFVAREDDFSTLLKRIGDCRKKTMAGMRLLGGKADVIKGFAKRCNEQYSVTPRGEIGLYLGDIQDHIVTMMGNLAHFEKMLSRSHANYLAQLSMESIQANNRSNEVLGKITVIATILVPLNLVCGLFGMNVPVPGQASGELYWFFGILGSICAFVVASFYIAKRWKLV